MIKGYIIKKIGEDIYIYYDPKNDGYGDWYWEKFPFVFRFESDAEQLAEEWNNANVAVEVKRADIFITP